MGNEKWHLFEGAIKKFDNYIATCLLLLLLNRSPQILGFGAFQLLNIFSGDGFEICVI